ncbi:cupredoxin family copper-binding protein [Kribbella qitaiheensis]|uniref:cupredoxin domain-containing protein n=1 Tax=Kribbella qitaiheensis TaxID=1544730 RepID=UPI00360BA0C1
MKRTQILCDSSLRPRRLLVGLVALLAVLVLATGCSPDSDSGGSASSAPATQASSSGSAAPAGGSMVEINNFMFTPQTLTVAVGTTVTWKFDDSTQHTVTADDNSFASSPMSNGQTFTHTFSAAGTVAYHCSIHPEMTATITVK